MKKSLPPCLMSIFKNDRMSEVDYEATIPVAELRSALLLEDVTGKLLLVSIKNAGL